MPADVRAQAPLAAGTGWYSFELRTPPAMVETAAFGANVGAGLLYAVSPQVRLRGDLRYFNHTHGTASDPEGLVVVDDVPTTWRFVGGITVQLGGGA